jgi:hypothetical protein
LRLSRFISEWNMLSSTESRNSEHNGVRCIVLVTYIDCIHARINQPTESRTKATRLAFYMMNRLMTLRECSKMQTLLSTKEWGVVSLHCYEIN